MNRTMSRRRFWLIHVGAGIGFWTLILAWTFIEEGAVRWTNVLSAAIGAAVYTLLMGWLTLRFQQQSADAQNAQFNRRLTYALGFLLVLLSVALLLR
jgi:uncharacterized protein YacL